jgi:hypothetical protein
VLTVDGTDEVVGNQTEYKFALLDNLASAPVLTLKVQLFPRKTPIKRKRKEDADDRTNVTRDFKPNLRSGTWNNGEIALFAKGVERFGWSKWRLIAKLIETRNNQQVKTFSESAVGIRFKPADISHSYMDLAAGFKICAEELQAHNPIKSGMRKRQIEEVVEFENESEAGFSGVEDL